ncbi:MAG: DinB family protein [Planctomycetota bacterium]
MSIKPNIIYSIEQSRRMLDSLINEMKSPEDWMFQVHPQANHPLWVVGHLGLADNMFISRLDETAGSQPEGWEEVFWFGSEISSDASRYPAPEEVVAYCRERRQKLLSLIEGLSDEFLMSPTPDEGMFADAPNMAQMLFFIAYHEGVHSGQFTIAHRGLGHQPLFKPNPQPTA